MFNNITDRQIPDEKFFGFYRGIVIDNNDPKQNGRIKIRVYPMFDGVSDEALPWAIYADPSMGGISDVGKINVPLLDSHVFLFFENGDHRYPVYFAGAPAIKDDIPDSPKLSREDDGTVENIKNNISSGVATASGGSWDEPESAYAAEYPNNKVYKTEKGITVEFDDTEDNVRIHVYHPSGTRTEIDNLGNQNEHVVGNKTTVIVGNNNIEIQGNFDITVNGNAGIYVKGQADILVDMDTNLTVGGNVVGDITGNVDLTSGGNLTADIGGTASVTVGGTTTIVSSGAVDVTAPSAKVHSTDIQLDADGILGNIVSTNHVCSFTGAPHPQGSLTCKAGG